MKRKVFLVVGLCLLGVLALVVGIPVGKRAYQEYREHLPWRYISLRKLPEDNGVPRLFINTNTGLMVQNKKHYTEAQYALYVDGTEVQGGDIQVKGHGNTTWTSPKKSYILRFREPEGMLGLPEARRWILLNPFFDKTMLRNDLAYHLGRTIYTNMKWVPHLVDVEVVMNGKYLGVYQLAERIDIASGRVDIPSGGVVMEFSKDDGTVIRTPHTRMLCKDPDKKIPEKDLETWTEAVLDFDQRLYSPDFGNYQEVFDLSSFIDWYLVQEFAKNNDAKYGGSTYWYYDPRDKKLHFGPIWDFDIGFGNEDLTYDTRKPEGFHVNQFVYAGRLLEDPACRSLLKSRWNSTKGCLWEEIHTYLPEHSAYLEQARTWNYKAWDYMDIEVWPQAYAGYTYEEQYDYLLHWLETRWQWLDEAINAL